MYIKQLDGLRCFAVLAVVVSHTLFYPFVIFFDLGKIGVDIFFTLSGFLITGILLAEKKKILTGKSSIGKGLGYFYARRFLRIFPLYYLVIFSCLFFNFYPARECFPWLVSFTSNWEIAHPVYHQQFLSLVHFWSLGVEEQFYVLFPMLILFVPKGKTIKIVLIALIFAGVITRMFFFFYVNNVEQAEYAAYFSTPGCLDALCMGALLSLKMDKFISQASTLRSRSKFVISVLLFLLFITSASIFKDLAWGIITGRFFTALFTTWLIINIVGKSLPVWADTLLQFKPVIYIGKISFGIYVLHLPLIELLTKYCKKSLPPQIPLTMVIFISVLLGATISWELLEKRILVFKKKFVT